MGNSQTKYTEELATLHNKFYDQLLKIVDCHNGLYDNVINIDGKGVDDFPNIKRFDAAMLLKTRSSQMTFCDVVPYDDRYQGILDDITTINDAVISLDAIILLLKRPFLEDKIEGITADVSPGGKINDKALLPDPSLKGNKKHEAHMEDTQKRLDVLIEKVKFFETQSNFLETTYKTAFAMDQMAGDSDEDVDVFTNPTRIATAPPAYNSVDVKS